jgi:hypothetical protein
MTTRTVTALAVWVAQVKGTARTYDIAAESRTDAEDLFREFIAGTVLDGRAFTVAGKDQCLLAWSIERREQA